MGQSMKRRRVGKGEGPSEVEGRKAEEGIGGKKRGCLKKKHDGETSGQWKYTPLQEKALSEEAMRGKGTTGKGSETPIKKKKPTCSTEWKEGPERQGSKNIKKKSGTSSTIGGKGRGGGGGTNQERGGKSPTLC